MQESASRHQLRPPRQPGYMQNTVHLPTTLHRTTTRPVELGAKLPRKQHRPKQHLDIVPKKKMLFDIVRAVLFKW